MKQINDYIIEKFKINSKTVNKDSKSHVFTDEELQDPNTYETCDIPEWDEYIDRKLDEWKQLKRGILNNYKKRKNSKGINNNWYRFYCYLYYNGPSRKEDVVKGVKGDTPSHYHETFTNMKWAGILSNSKGKWEAINPKNWE